MTLRHRFVASALAAALAAGASPALAQDVPDSTWDQVLNSGKLRAGVVDSPPNFVRNVQTGEWTGAMVDMSKDMAKALGVELELVDVGGWGQVVLALQANRTDVQFSLQATPVRAKAIVFAGPIRQDVYALINSPKTAGFTDWKQYDTPEIRIAYQVGGASETIMKKLVPNATLLGLRNISEVILSLKSQQADAAASTTLAILGQLQKDPTLGTFSLPAPEFALPAYVGMRPDRDPRMREFVEMWAEWNRNTGVFDQMMKENLRKIGVTDIPEGVHF